MNDEEKHDEDQGTVLLNIDLLEAEAEAERAAEDAEILKGIDYAEYRPPTVSVIRAFLVLCPATTCGMVAARDKKDQADAVAKQHREKHLEMNKRAAIMLKRFRDSGAQFTPGRVGAPEVEVKSLEDLDKAQREEPDTLKDNGYLDWQFGSEASNRDPEKMWHRGACKGEVVIINMTRVCSKCGRADTPDGRVPILDIGEEGDD